MSAQIETVVSGEVLEGHTGRYRLLQPLGAPGATAEVFLVRREEDGRELALKLMHRDLQAPMRQRFLDEMLTLERLRDAESSLGTRHVPRIVECSNLREEATQRLRDRLGRPFLLMDLARGEDLKQRLIHQGRLEEREALEIVRQFAEVLYAVHNAGFTYSDMKLDNLIWNEEEEHLTVIDWNVVEEGRLAEDAGRDRLRAAAYLYEMTTGAPMPVVVDGDGVAQAGDRRFRRNDAFLGLTAGTRHFLLTAFHPDPSSRHGGEEDPIEATREFLAGLSAQRQRFDMTFEELFERGKDAFADRQWREAMEDLEVLRWRARSSLAEDRRGELETMLVEARRETERLGRGAFYSGLGRYRKGLYREAVDDFEIALKDDPLDEEARLHAIEARLAARLGEASFEPLSRAVKDCVGALFSGNLGLAREALGRLTEEARALPEARALAAEIEVRDALRQSRELQEEGSFQAAEDRLREAYGHRDDLLYVEQLEETLGSPLQRQYSDVEQLRRLVSRGEAHLQRSELREAEAVLWQCRALAPDVRSVRDRHQKAAALAEIQELLRRRDLEGALREYEHAASLYRGEPRLATMRLEALDQLRRKTAEARRRQDHQRERDLLEKTCHLDPRDANAAARLEEIAKDLTAGYRDSVAALAGRLEAKRSLETCESVLAEVRSHGWDRHEEGRALVEEARSLAAKITEMARRFDEITAAGDLSREMDLFNEVEAARILLDRGDGREAWRASLERRLFERRVLEVEDQLRSGAVEKAREECDGLLAGHLDADRREQVEALRQRSFAFAGARLHLDAAATALGKVADPGSLEAVERRLDHCLAAHRLKEAEPLYEKLPDVADLKRRLWAVTERLLSRWRPSVSELSIAGPPGEQASLRERVTRILPVLDLLVDTQGFESQARRWKTWCEELLRLEEHLRVGRGGAGRGEIEETAPSVLAPELQELVGDPEAREWIASARWMGGDSSPPATVCEISPIAVWLREQARLHQARETRRERCVEIRQEVESKIEAYAKADLDKLTNLELSISNHLDALRELDERAAEELAVRFDRAVEYVLKTPVSRPEDPEALAELQRRVLESAETQPERPIENLLAELERDPSLGLAVPEYRRRRRQLVRPLKAANRKRGAKKVEALLDLRLRFGEFPELREELRRTKREIADGPTRDRFHDLAGLDLSTFAESWETHSETLRTIDPKHLDEAGCRQFYKLQEAARHLKLLDEEATVDRLEDYLVDFDGEKAKAWSEALLWAGENTLGLRLHQKTRSNVETAMRNLLDQGRLSVGTMGAFYFVEHLLGSPETRQLVPGTAAASESLWQSMKSSAARRWNGLRLRFLLHRDGGRALAALRSLAPRVFFPKNLAWSRKTLPSHLQEHWRRWLDRSGNVKPLSNWRILGWLTAPAAVVVLLSVAWEWPGRLVVGDPQAAPPEVASVPLAPPTEPQGADAATPAPAPDEPPEDEDGGSPEPPPVDPLPELTASSGELPLGAGWTIRTEPQTDAEELLVAEGGESLPLVGEIAVVGQELWLSVAVPTSAGHRRGWIEIDVPWASVANKDLLTVTDGQRRRLRSEPLAEEAVGSVNRGGQAELSGKARATGGLLWLSVRTGRGDCEEHDCWMGLEIAVPAMQQREETES